MTLIDKLMKLPPRPHLTPEEIKQIRGNLGLTQDALALCLGVPTNTVAVWECGKRNCKGAAAKLLLLMGEGNSGGSPSQ